MTSQVELGEASCTFTVEVNTESAESRLSADSADRGVSCRLESAPLIYLCVSPLDRIDKRFAAFGRGDSEGA